MHYIICLIYMMTNKKGGDPNPHPKNKKKKKYQLQKN